jgi:hypothetical protein
MAPLQPVGFDQTAHLPFVQVTYLGTTENTGSGIGTICHAAPAADHRSYKIIYSGI